jgi:hypothetical protein
MDKVRKIAMVANQVKMENEDRLDVAYWLSRYPTERISAVTSLRRRYFTWLNGSFPTKMGKSGLSKEDGCLSRINI